MIKIFLYTTIFFTIIFGCKKKAFHQDNRTFFMGVTPSPPDYSDVAINRTYNFINTNCDMITNQIDAKGIPWQEALENKSYPEEFLKDINERLNKNNNRIVFLAVSALDASRVNRVGYWAENNDSVAKKWQKLKFDDTLVSNAYFNYTCFLIDKFQPKFCNYSVESNSMDWQDAEFERFLIFLARVYSKLKVKYPTLPIFASYAIGLEEKWVTNAKRINPYSDHISISTYPYLYIGSKVNGVTDPITIPSNWYSRFRDIDSNKPFSVSEAGYIAEDLNLLEVGLTKKGNPVWQADFLQKLFEVCNKYNAVFVSYYIAYDYDNGYNSFLASGGYAPFFKAFKDVGLYDGNGIERPSLTVWKKWYNSTLSQ